MSRGKNYHNYVIKDGKFIGAFEEMYQNVEDPWHQTNVDTVPYEITLYLLKKYGICQNGGKVLDVGCGLGVFTAKLKEIMPKAEITATDVSPTAIKKAKSRFEHLGIDFSVMDIQVTHKKYQLTCMT